MKILAVNWLDRENPQAGGAEVHFFEVFRRLVDGGHSVTLVCSGFQGCEPRTVIDGIEVRRFGGRYSFALRGRRAVRNALRANGYDLVVEDINKLPLFLPTLTSLPFYAIVPHLFGTTAFQEASFPVASAVWFAERLIPKVYRRTAFHAISDSTREDLVRRGVPARSVRVIYPGVDSSWFTPESSSPRFDVPTFLYVGRVRRYKGIETALRALALARRKVDAIRFEIAGDGGDRPRLERVSERLGLGGAVRFLGYVNEEEKRSLLRRSWAVVLPSAKEGWGITNIEAAACGTPAIASDSPGLRETVRDRITGLLVPHDDPQALAEALVRFSTEPQLVARFGGAARDFARTLSWDQAAQQTQQHLLETIEAHQRPPKEGAEVWK